MEARVLPPPSKQSKIGVLLRAIDHSLEIQVCKYYLRWALKSVNNTYIELFGSLGITFYLLNIQQLLAGGQYLISDPSTLTPVLSIAALGRKYSMPPDFLLQPGFRV